MVYGLVRVSIWPAATETLTYHGQLPPPTYLHQSKRKGIKGVRNQLYLTSFHENTTVPNIERFPLPGYPPLKKKKKKKKEGRKKAGKKEFKHY